MLINAYDTTVGQPFRVKDDVAGIIKTLHMSRNLTQTKKKGVFCLTQETELKIPIFAFPITMQSHTREMITVYDERSYRNKSNQVTHPNEITISRLAAFLQQDVAEGVLTPLKNGRLLATKGFSESVSTLLVRNGGLDKNEALTLKVLLAYYFLSLQESNTDDVVFIGVNVIRSLYGTEKDYILGVVEELPQMANLTDLLKAIHSNPILFKLKYLTLKELIANVGSISFAALGPKIVSAAAEAPCLFTALVYGVVKFSVYNRLPLGVALDPKAVKETVNAFRNNIEYTYDLNG
jgi:hypothetical protein